MNERTSFWSEGASLWLPPQRSTTAHEIDAVFNFILYTSTILTLGVAAAIIYFAWKYRRRSPLDHPQVVHENKLLELSWVVLPTIMVLVVFFWGFRAYVGTSIPPTDAYEIRVRGQQWFWTFEYPNGSILQGEVYVPAGQPVVFRMTSRDVLHSFFVPEFRIKNDVIPNRSTNVWFEAPQEGTYQVLCTEYCGTAHSNMGAKIHVVGRDEFFAYLRDGFPDQQADLPLDQVGEQLYTSKGCNACHTLDGTPSVGPSWLGNWGRPRPGTAGSPVMDEAYVREAILAPNAHVVTGFQPQMPSYEGLLNDRQIDGIIAYIQELNGVEPTGGAPADSAMTGDSVIVPGGPTTPRATPPTAPAN
ncbi:MAG TPA: cytochrome c oxidase subunit II [Rubricoccaceae bacterium]|nr:cytochrome c oxidase subunit II [Rubricoccaceae bacterium]